jgi:hypothetical protein
MKEGMQRIIAPFVVAGSLITSGCVTAQYGGRPAAWCGWQARQEVALDPGPKFNRALEWKKFGINAGGPCVGCIVIWNRGRGKGHVGIITGRKESGDWIVRSGNDGHELRERPRTITNAVAFRRPQPFGPAI